MEVLILRGNQYADIFNEGMEYRAYRYFGCHIVDGGYAFRVWAPSAEKVFVVGSFNDWSESFPMIRVGDTAIWEGFVPDGEVEPGDLYKFKLVSGNEQAYKADPFAAYSGVWPESASRVFPVGEYQWGDSLWMKERKKRFNGVEARKQPVSIYELHIPSWKKKFGSEPLSYKELADSLAPYLLQMGFTHVEIMEPFEQVEGKKSCFYALSACHGTPYDFMEFVDNMHRAGIGVILDWNIYEFSVTEHSLSGFDGYNICGEIKEGCLTGRFDLSSRVAHSFIVSNAVYLADVFHIDGIRVDAVSSMLYLNYARKEGEYTPNREGGNINLGAVDFLRKLNHAVLSEFPGSVTIAEKKPWIEGLLLSFAA